jgi:hypothetical protein
VSLQEEESIFYFGAIRCIVWKEGMILVHFKKLTAKSFFNPDDYTSLRKVSGLRE